MGSSFSWPKLCQSPETLLEVLAVEGSQEIKIGMVGLLWLHPLKFGGNLRRLHYLFFIHFSLLGWDKAMGWCIIPVLRGCWRAAQQEQDIQRKSQTTLIFIPLFPYLSMFSWGCWKWPCSPHTCTCAQFEITHPKPAQRWKERIGFVFHH